MKSWALLACLLPTAGCATAQLDAPVVPPTGILFANQAAPLQVDFEETTLGSKKGERTHTHYIHDIVLTGTNFAWGEAAIEEAAREAGIERVNHADYKILNVLGVYTRFTVRVYGD